MSRKVRHTLILLAGVVVFGLLYWWGERAVTKLRFGSIEAVVEGCRQRHGVSVEEIRRRIVAGTFTEAAIAAAADAGPDAPFYRCLADNKDFDAAYFAVYARVKDPAPWGPSHE